jgi:hypothetical protein
MATYNKFDTFMTDVADGVHAASLNADTDVWKVYLSNAAPSASLDAVKADLAEITAENGYPAGGVDAQNAATQTDAVITVAGTDVVITASGGTIGPFQYVVLYNDTPTSPADPLISWWDRGSPITLQDGESVTIDLSTDVLAAIGG